MYGQKLHFFIVSERDELEQLFLEAEVLEDCEYFIRTVPTAAQLEEAGGLDTAVIFDSLSGTGLPHEMPKGQESVLLIHGAGALAMDESVVGAVSDIWLMPSENDYDSALLLLYFHRLASRMKERADARKQAICFDTLINSVPNISWFKDVDGAHLIVNDSFCNLVEKQKQDIYKKGHCYIWNASKADEAVCLSSDRIIMESRRTNVFEESVKVGSKSRLLRSYKSALIDEDGEIFGTCGIAEDVTDMRNMNSELDVILNSIPFAVLVKDINGIVLNKNTKFDQYFPKFTDITGKSSEKWEKGLTKKLLLEGAIKEVVVQNEGEAKFLVFEEQPILDIFQEEVGKIVTLMDITLERSIAKQNEYSANTDYLTGLYNRRYLMNYLENLEKKEAASIVMLDLDNFKQVNDTFGHGAGDRALVKAADILNECFQGSMISRWGGDEFVVVIEGEEIGAIKQRVDSLLMKLCTSFGSKQEFEYVTGSVGILATASLSAEHRTPGHLLQLVDAQMYRAKQNGKNRYSVYGEE